MKKFFILTLFALIATINLFSDEILIEKGHIYNGEISALNKKLTIQGEVRDSLFLVGCRLELSGKINGDLIMLGGSLKIEKTAFIQKDLILVGVDLEMPADFKPQGEIFNIKSRRDLKEMAAKILPFFPEDQSFNFLILIKILIWTLTAFLILAIFPQKVISAQQMLSKNWKKFLLNGLLLFLLMIILMVVSLILSVFLIGLPLLILLLLVYFLMIVFGRSVVFYSLGMLFFEKSKLKKPDPAFNIIPGAIVYASGKLLGLIGLPLILIIDFFALSCSFYFLFKKKFNLPE